MCGILLRSRGVPARSLLGRVAQRSAKTRSPRTGGGSGSNALGNGVRIGDQETQRPAICASGDCPMALTIGSQPSSRRGLGAGVPVGAFVSAGLFTALWLFTGTRGMRSLLSDRLIVSVVWPSEGAAVVAETSRPMRKHATAKAAPPKPARYDWLRIGRLPRSLCRLVA